VRIIFLNSWLGKQKLAIKKFFEEQSANTDFFCLQEVSPEFFEELKSCLSNYNGFYIKGRIAVTDGNMYGQAIFIKKGIKSEVGGRVRIYNQLGDDIGFLQYQSVIINGKTLWLGNVHGKTKPGTKKDTVIRIKQSQKIIDFFKDKVGPVIFGGDFNLLPDTKSIRMLEDAGYKNLIKDFNVKMTRNEISWKQFGSQPGYVKQYFADFVFVNSKVNVRNFEVPYLLISDHLPQILDFEV